MQAAIVNAYPLPARRGAMPGPGALPVALMVALCITVEAISRGRPAALLCDFTLIAVVVAAIERRHGAMLVATGMAIGLAPFGAMLLPLAIGIVVQRRVGATTLLLIPATACATMLAIGAMSVADVRVAIGLWAILPVPALYGLLVAIALGSLAWLTAALTARPLHGADLALAATVATLAFALVTPQALMVVPVALGLLVPDRRIPVLAATAALLAAFVDPVPATFALAAALFIAARALLRPAANDNPVLAVV